MVKPMYPDNYWSVRVAAEKEQARRAARLDRLEDAAWIGFLILYVFAAAALFALKELPHGAQAVPVWIGEVVFFTVTAVAAWRYERIT